MRIAVVFALLGLTATPIFAGAMLGRNDYLELGNQVIRVRSRTPISCSRFSLDHDYVLTCSFSGDSSTLAYFSVDEQGVYLTRALLKPLSLSTVHQWALGEAMPCGRIVWAPRGDALYFQLEAGGEGQMVTQTWLAAAPWKELQPLDLRGEWDAGSEPAWSPNGQLLAYLFAPSRSEVPPPPDPTGPTAPTAPPRPEGIWVYDLKAKASRLVWAETELDKIVGWANDHTISFVRKVPEPGRGIARTELVQVGLNPAQPPVVTPDPYLTEPERLSADRKWQFRERSARAAADIEVVPVDQPDDAHVVKLTSNKRSRFVAWSPTDVCLAYVTPQTTKDDSGKIMHTSDELWLAAVAQGKHRQLLVAQGLDQSSGDPCWSPDGKRIAYISDGILYVAVLDRLSADEAQATRKSYERMVQTQALTNVKQLGLSLLMYSDDNDDQLPSDEDIEKTLEPYLLDSKFFYSVEDATTPVFTYLPPASLKLSDIADPANTVIGYMDYGYGWRVELYADGHAVIRQ